MNRRNFIGTMLAAGAGFSIARSGILMPVRKIYTLEEEMFVTWLQKHLAENIERLLYSHTEESRDTFERRIAAACQVPVRYLFPRSEQ